MTKSLDADGAQRDDERLADQVLPDTVGAEVRSTARVSFFAVDGDSVSGRLDAAAGCEFVDDRIRLPE